jgi:fermentation-respiration switch protein FrsA (DUF1100 family)
MATTTIGACGERALADTVPAEAATSAVSWGAIIGGGFVIASTGLTLVALGSGFGLASVSAWPGAGVSATTFGVMTGIWLIVTQMDFGRFGWLCDGTPPHQMDGSA